MSYLSVGTPVKLKTKAVSQRYQTSLNNLEGVISKIENNEYIVKVNGEKLPFTLDELCDFTGKSYSKIYDEDTKKLIEITNESSIGTFPNLFTRAEVIEIGLKYGNYIKSKS